MKKVFFIVPLVFLLFLFTFIFFAGLSLGKLINQANADEIMPYGLIGPNDNFSLSIKTDQKGETTALTYFYEYAD